MNNNNRDEDLNLTVFCCSFYLFIPFQPAETVESGDEDSNTNAANDSTGEVEGEGDFPCDICKQSFRNAKYLFRHMAMHTELFKCESCGKCYSRKDSLQRHVLKCCPQLAEDYSVFACDKSVGSC